MLKQQFDIVNSFAIDTVKKLGDVEIVKQLEKYSIEGELDYKDSNDLLLIRSLFQQTVQAANQILLRNKDKAV
jgi:hypothetical protein